HMIEFTGRDRFLDKLEEKVTQEEVERVISELNRSGGCGIREFIVGTDVAKRHHVWVLAGMAAGEGPTQRLDNHLRQLNADHATFREQGRIAAPEVITVPSDLIYEWSGTVRGKLGGQTKIPHIDPTPDGSMVMSLKEFSLKQAA
ncbi:MAG: GH3 auxin-responsive promoter family protein, partial [Deltaproteobacteria bacterium]